MPRRAHSVAHTRAARSSPSTTRSYELLGTSDGLDGGGLLVGGDEAEHEGGGARAERRPRTPREHHVRDRADEPQDRCEHRDAGAEREAAAADAGLVRGDERRDARERDQPEHGRAEPEHVGDVIRGEQAAEQRVARPRSEEADEEREATGATQRAMFLRRADHHDGRAAEHQPHLEVEMDHALQELERHVTGDQRTGRDRREPGHVRLRTRGGCEHRARQRDQEQPVLVVPRDRQARGFVAQLHPREEERADQHHTRDRQDTVCPTRKPFVHAGEANTILPSAISRTIRGRSTCSSCWLRACWVAGVSPAVTGTATGAWFGPPARVAATTGTWTPLSFAPAVIAWPGAK